MSNFAPINIADYLPYRAQQNPDLLAVAVPIRTDKNGKSSYNKLNYLELDQLSDVYARGLLAHGIKPGMRCVLMVKPSIEFFAFTFALFKIGAVMICIDPGMGIKNIKTCLEESEPEAFIGIAKAQVAKRLFSWPKCIFNIWVTPKKQNAVWGIPTQHQLEALGQKSDQDIPSLDSSDDLAAILFTSGSTGVPKGVVYKHAHFLAQVKALLALYDIQVGEVDLCTFPLFALFAPALGMSSVVPDMDFTKPGSVNPLHVIQPINEFSVTNMFGSPALIKRVAGHGKKHQSKLPSLKRAISAGAPVSPQALEDFSSLLNDDINIFTPYGATESLPVASIGSREILSEHRALTDLGKGVCVGKPAINMHVDIIPISDEPILQWNSNMCLGSNVIGEICVIGDVVTERYFNRPQSTALAKIIDGSKVHHRMGDLGYFDDNGKLWFCGRKAHRVETENKSFYSVPCESIFNTHKDVERSALVKLHGPNGIEPGICIELANKTSDKQQLVKDLQSLADNHEHCVGIKKFFIYPSFPVDIRHNAKINREALSIWANKQKALQA